MALAWGRWQPAMEEIQSAARATLVDGTPSDFATHLFALTNANSYVRWDLSSLTNGDKERLDGLSAMTMNTGRIFRRSRFSPALGLALRDRWPGICGLSYPMMLVFPVTGLRHYLKLHADCAFASIRASAHPRAEELIAFLYELLVLQQKSALSLLTYVDRMATAESKDDGSFFPPETSEAIMAADTVGAYLKATVEKTLAFAALAHCVDGLDDRGTHSKRMARFARGLDERGVGDTYYKDFLMEAFAAKNLTDINNLRTGVLHKKGFRDLQPHAYVGTSKDSHPFSRVFGLLHAQHARNTAALVVALALLCDELMKAADVPSPRTDVP